MAAKKTGYYGISSGTITNNSVSYNGTNIFSESYTVTGATAASYASQKGDSGGMIYNDNYILGIHLGDRTILGTSIREAVFQKVLNIASILGIAPY